jgi:hypothetical protein
MKTLPITVGVTAFAFAVSCAPEAEAPTARDYPTAGLYTPGSMLGASDPTDVPLPGMGLGQRCVTPAGAGSADAGTMDENVLTVTYETQSLDGRYAPKNCEAVWVETPEGQYVATLEVTAGLRRPGLVYWQERACTQELGPDALTSATLREHKEHEVTWTGVDFMGRPMPDGPYKLYVEVTETDKEPGDLATFDFVKGPESSVDAPVSADGPITKLNITWGKEGGL